MLRDPSVVVTLLLLATVHTAIMTPQLAASSSGSAAQPFVTATPSAATKAQNQLERLKQLQQAQPTWTSVGPSPIQTRGGNLYSGRVSAIAIDPNNPSTIYLGGAQGGVWKSTNGGSSWTPLTDSQPTLAVGSIAIDSSGNIYVGTGEGNGACDSYYGAGILKSTDGGNTWLQLGASTFGHSAVGKIVANGNTVIVATRGGHQSSSTNSCSLAVPFTAGIYVSSDSGNTWTRTLAATSSAFDVVLDPTSSLIVYAATDRGIYKSTDGGLTWTGPLGGGFPSGVGRIALGISASSHLTLLAAVETYPPSTPSGQLYRTSDGGSTWSQVSTPSGFCGTPPYAQCWYDIFVAVDPSTANTLYLGGLDLYRTTDGGATWTDLGGYVGYTHPDQHAFAFSPTSHTTIYSGNDGGIWSSTSGDTCLPSACWTNLNAGLTLAQFQYIATHPTDGNIYFGGTQDNGSPEQAGISSIWTQLVGGDGGWVAFDRNNPSTMYHTFYGVSPQRSDDGGSTWLDITTGINTNDRAQFYIPMAMDPSTPATLYLGTYRLYKTTNQGNNWNLPAPGLALSTGQISAIEVAPSNGQYVYVGTTSGTFWTSSDGGSNFAERDAGLPTGSRFLTKIAVDAANPQKVYVTFSGFGGLHVFVSANSGTSWSDITSNLPDVPANAVAIDQSGTIYAGTDIGVYASTNGGTSWSPLGTGLPHVAVYDLKFTADGKLLAATHGRGVWKFTTLTAAAPTVTTLAATNIGSTSATLQATVNPNGLATTWNFVNPPNAIWCPSPPGSLPAGSTPVTVNCVATGLTPSTTYQYYARATNAGGTSSGSTLSFTTLATRFGFSMSNSGEITVIQGSSGSNTITVTLTSGSTQPVSLSCTGGLPSGASCTGFSVSPGNPTFSSTLTISALSTTAVGSYAITVTGTGGGQTQTTQFTLTVSPAVPGFSIEAVLVGVFVWFGALALLHRKPKIKEFARRL